MGKWLIRLFVLVLLAAGVWAGWRTLHQEEKTEIRATRLVRGGLLLSVTATGRLVPTTEVLVGCEVSGTVQELLVSHNEAVRKGQVIARLKPEFYRAEYGQARAELIRANAHLKQLQTKEAEAKRQYERVVRLQSEGAASEDEFKIVLASYEAAQADTQAGGAAVDSAQSNVDLTKYRLDRTEITSPIDGIVLDRKVDVGQTVAATLMTPELFLLAEDLSRMELLADISEADVGYVCPGQVVTFTVNAYRDRTFDGKVKQIRNQPKTVGSVVTYTVVIDVVNEERLLRPGMPADVTIEIVRDDSVTKIANAALRFRPPLPPEQIRQVWDELQWPAMPEPIRVATPSASHQAADIVPPPIEHTKAILWQSRADGWNPVPVWTAYTDNRETLVVGDADLTEGTEFITEVIGGEDSVTGTVEQAILMTRPENRRF